jgi:pimeloyl-ACP methyl ester carboxylesterase
MKIHWEKMGSNNGVPLVCLHGWNQTLEGLKPLANLLKKDRPIYLLDLPGFGRSVQPQETWGTSQYAHCIYAHLKDKNLFPCHFLGHSFGGKIAATLAYEYPDEVKKLILMATSGLQKKRKLSEKIQFFGKKKLGKLLKFYDKTWGSSLFQNWFVPRYGSRDYKQAGNMRSVLVKLVHEDLTKIFANLEKPTLILWGEKDEETPIEMAHQLHHLITFSKIAVFPLQGHMLHEDIGGHLAARYITSFLEEETAL